MKTSEACEEEKEDVKDRLLQLIEEGDPTVILSSQYLESLNELIKHEFISIEDDSLKLTEKGLQAKTVGFKKMIGQSIFVEEEKKEIFRSQQKISRVSNRSFLILLFFFLVSILMIITITGL